MMIYRIEFIDVNGNEQIRRVRSGELETQLEVLQSLGIDEFKISMDKWG